MKHTSTVLEPSIPFHTLVKLLDAEDIANDKIRTHDLALEINNITIQLNTQTLDPSSQEQLICLHNPKIQITKRNLPIKNNAHTVIEQIIPSLLVSKNNEMMKTNEKHMLDLNLHKNVLYNTSVLLPTIEQNTMIIDTEVEVLHETTVTIKTIHKIDTVLHLEIDLVTIKATLVLDTDHAPIPVTTNSQNIQIHIDHLQDQETPDFVDLARTPIPETKLIRYNNKTNLTL